MNSFGSQTRYPSLSQRCNHFSAVEGEEMQSCLHKKWWRVPRAEGYGAPQKEDADLGAERRRRARHMSEKASRGTAPGVKRACLTEAPAFAPARTQGLRASPGLEDSSPGRLTIIGDVDVQGSSLPHHSVISSPSHTHTQSHQLFQDLPPESE